MAYTFPSDVRLAYTSNELFAFALNWYNHVSGKWEQQVFEEVGKALTDTKRSKDTLLLAAVAEAFYHEAQKLTNEKKYSYRARVNPKEYCTTIYHVISALRGVTSSAKMFMGDSYLYGSDMYLCSCGETLVHCADILDPVHVIMANDKAKRLHAALTDLANQVANEYHVGIAEQLAETAQP